MVQKLDLLISNPKKSKLILLGANRDPELIPEGLLEGKVNYFIGNDPVKWNTNISIYRAVVYKEVYKGIDIRYYGNNRQLEYDIVVKPGADPQMVRLWSCSSRTPVSKTLAMTKTAVPTKTGIKKSRNRRSRKFPGLTISGAYLRAANQVALVTSAQTPGTRYTLYVNNVRDTTPTGRMIVPNSSVNFTAYNFAWGRVTVDLFTGNLTLRYRDIFIPGPNGLNIEVWRVYNSKVLYDRPTSQPNPTVQAYPKHPDLAEAIYYVAQAQALLGQMQADQPAQRQANRPYLAAASAQFRYGFFGRNGAGKTTLMNTVSGLILDMKKKEERRGGERITVHGEIRFEGEEISNLKPSERVRRGIVLSRERHPISLRAASRRI
jgi:hypothetical protein